MKITTMTMNDYPAAYQIWTQAEGVGLRTLDDSEAGIQKFLERNPNTNFVCKVEDNLVGTILCGHDGRRAYIYHALVAEEYRSRGIGRNLVNKLIQALKEEGITKVGLVVYTNNNQGNLFWEKLGFDQREDLYYRNKVINQNNK
ncbi:GNAT family N-acetyltransferase [Spirochaeta cellobiosiphila]|uniref:GNAT family N-acetyltransferase n=1 Tax=Spirochaeta cellobiosiphila TaxID=504483 RepID=UPI00040BF9F0|nr:GNAT family N-acetyltransferase [Spirochaeta cellobiosiphila]